jgi:hypothetical protein
MFSTPGRSTLTGRHRAILRAVEAGRGEALCGCPRPAHRRPLLRLHRNSRTLSSRPDRHRSGTTWTTRCGPGHRRRAKNSRSRCGMTRTRTHTHRSRRTGERHARLHPRDRRMPECAAPAEVVDRFVLESTDGPIEHAIVLCVLRHRFTVLVERLVSPRPPSPDRSAAVRRERHE